MRRKQDLFSISINKDGIMYEREGSYVGSVVINEPNEELCQDR